jgi:hypothetical protein
MNFRRQACLARVATAAMAIAASVTIRCVPTDFSFAEDDASGPDALETVDGNAGNDAPSDGASLDGPFDSAAPESGSDATNEDGPAATYKRIFITSGTFTGNLGGASGADSACGSAASFASLSGTWKAFLSTATSSAASRLSHASVPYRLMNGTVVANDWAGLTSGTLMTAIDRDEHGNVITFVNSPPFPGLVWTASKYDGTYIGSVNCNDFTTSSSGTNGTVGIDNATNTQWTVYLGVTDGSSCAGTFSLYCVEQ